MGLSARASVDRPKEVVINLMQPAQRVAVGIALLHVGVVQHVQSAAQLNLVPFLLAGIGSGDRDQSVNRVQGILDTLFIGQLGFHQAPGRILWTRPALADSLFAKVACAAHDNPEDVTTQQNQI